MKLSRHALAAGLAVAGLAATATGAEAPSSPRARIERVAPRAAPKAAAATAASSYSVEVPYVQSYSAPNGGQSNTLVLNSAHSFNVTLIATDQRTGNTAPGVALPQTDTFGYFSLPGLTSNPSNPEVFVKILDGLAINGRYWVFYGHLTDLIYDLTVRDNVRGISHTYHKDAGNQPGGFDTDTFVAAALGAPTTKSGRALPATKAARLITPNANIVTSVDISNNTTSDSVNAVLQYCYSSAGAFVGCTTQRTIGIGHYDIFHQDDIVGYLGSLGDLPQSAVADSSGTLLVTFTNLPSQQGWEGTVSASTYNRVSQVDPLRGTVGCAIHPSLFFESATASVVGTARDTVPAPSALAGSISATLGIHNTDARATGQQVTVDVTLYNPATGAVVGTPITLSNIAPGELRFVDDLFASAGVPSNVTTVTVFADTRNTTGNSPTIEGFVLDQDTESLDTRYHEMKCAAGCF